MTAFLLRSGLAISYQIGHKSSIHSLILKLIRLPAGVRMKDSKMDYVIPETYSMIYRSEVYEKYLKDMCNILIGKFETSLSNTNTFIVEKVCNFNERMMKKGYYIKYDDDVYLQIGRAHV